MIYRNNSYENYDYVNYDKRVIEDCNCEKFEMYKCEGEALYEQPPLDN